MNKKNKTVLMLFVLIALFSMFCTLKVNAARIVLEDNENPDYVTVLTINEDYYSIEIDEETGIGYFVRNYNNTYEVLGTCTVIKISRNNSEGEYICNSYEQDNYLGKIVINLTDNYGIVTYVDGNISEFINVNTIIEYFSE